MPVGGTDQGMGDLVQDHPPDRVLVIQVGERPGQADRASAVRAGSGPPPRVVEMETPAGQPRGIHQGAREGACIFPLHCAPASTPRRRFMETLLGVPRVWANMETRSSSAIHRACVSAAAARAS